MRLFITLQDGTTIANPTGVNNPIFAFGAGDRDWLDELPSTVAFCAAGDYHYGLLQTVCLG